jgi:predicted aspartyl protease
MSSGAQGYYGKLGEPLVALDLVVGEDRSHTLTALVDTGFTRGLAIFRNDAALPDLPTTTIAAEPIYFANGTCCETSWTFGYVRWLGRRQELPILVIHAEPECDAPCLIGMELLKGSDILLGEESFEIRLA